MQATLYKWDDAGAPQVVDGRPSEYINVIKKCLVDGYGTKAPAGWSVAEEDVANTYLALRNDEAAGGSGGVFEIKMVTNDDAGAAFDVTSYCDYVSNAQKNRGYATSRYDRHSTSISMLKNWIVIATKTAFIIWVCQDSRLTSNSFGTNKHISFFAGDFTSYINNDPATFICWAGGVNGSTAQGWNSNFAAHLQCNSPASASVRVYALDGTAETEGHSATSIIGPLMQSQDSAIAYDEPEITVLSEIYILAGAANSITDAYLNSVSFPRVRGTLPGVVCAQQAGFYNQPMPYFKTINGQLHFQLPNPHTYRSLIWINCEQW